MSPIVKAVADRWQLTVRAISTDSGPSRHFPNYTVESGQRPRMGLEPKITPALVLWDSEAGRAIPIGYGVLSADELQDRIFLLTSRSEEHTSELQSLMRISYAVFCLKKKQKPSLSTHYTQSLHF